MQNPFDLTGKVIAITGGGGILGAELAAGLAAAGASIAVLGRTQASLDKVVERIQKSGGKKGAAIAIPCDVLDRSRLEAACAQIISAFGKIDVLINGAGGNKKEATTGVDMPFFDMPADAIKDVFDLNFIGTLLPSQVFGREMARTGKGVILNVSSMSAYFPLTKVGAYSAAKAAINNFTQWLAVHLCQNYSKNLRVNAIAPGFFLTEQNRFLLTDKNTGKLTPRGETIVAHTPMGRFGEAAELVGAAIWLCSDASQFVTGIVLPVDGGFNAFSGV